MILMRILPGVLKELVKHVPTVLFEAVEWSVLASELPKLSRRLLQKEGYAPLFQHHQEFLRPYDIMLTEESLNAHEKHLPQGEAEKILYLYFAQIFSPEGLFLDLRPTHLHFENANRLKWNPPSLWTKFDETFREGLINIYDGFYREDDGTFYKGLQKIDLCSPDWPEEDQKKLGDLFKSHFGSSRSEAMKFEVEAFKKSLMNITDFLLKKKVKISPDFLYLGIYLVTLYSALEKSSEALDVKSIYMDVRNRYL
jgi:hypothetical protein